MENNPVNYSDPSGHKKNIFQKAWAWTKKTASNVVKTVKKAYNTVVNWVGNAVNSVKTWVGNTVNSVKTWVSNLGSGGSSPSPYGGGYPGLPSGYVQGYRGSPGSYYQISYAQQQAIQTALRQQQISSDYSRITGNKGIPKTKEGVALWKNWNDSLKETLTHFCVTGEKVKPQSAGVVALAPGATWGLPKIKWPSISSGVKVIGKTATKVLGKAVLIYTVMDVTNKAVNYIEHDNTNDLVVGGDITPEDVANAKVKGLLDKTKPGDETKGPTTQHEREGDYSDAEKDFDDLNLNDVKEIDMSTVCHKANDEKQVAELSWTPIGNFARNKYQGTFDGNGKTISISTSSMPPLNISVSSAMQKRAASRTSLSTMQR